jgi:hypothetical protein
MPYLTAKQLHALGILPPGVTVKRIYDLALREILPCTRLGDRVWFDPERVEQCLKDGGGGA